MYNFPYDAVVGKVLLWAIMERVYIIYYVLSCPDENDPRAPDAHILEVIGWNFVWSVSRLLEAQKASYIISTRVTLPHLSFCGSNSMSNPNIVCEIFVGTCLSAFWQSLFFGVDSRARRDECSYCYFRCYRQNSNFELPLLVHLLTFLFSDLLCY